MDTGTNSGSANKIISTNIYKSTYIKKNQNAQREDLFKSACLDWKHVLWSKRKLHLAPHKLFSLISIVRLKWSNHGLALIPCLVTTTFDIVSNSHEWLISSKKSKTVAFMIKKHAFQINYWNNKEYILIRNVQYTVLQIFKETWKRTGVFTI